MVNKTCFALAIFLTCAHFSTAQAPTQKFKKLRMGVGAGFGVASGKGAGAGLVGTVEPGFFITDQLLANVRVEVANLVRGTDESLVLDLDYAIIKSASVNGQYFFKNDILRPFAGAGIGVYELPEAEYGGEIAEVERAFGFYVRAGIDVGHFTFNIDYNLIPKTELGEAHYNNSYVGIRVGLHIGGGRIQ